MKIEKLNDNQIRCTLTRDDLAKRNLKISELAYGSEKTQNLFKEMIRQADYEYGFDTENVPLVVEAIPMNSDCIVLLITKVDDPEELDTRFSRFSQRNGAPEDINEGVDDDEDDFMKAPREEPVKPQPSFNEMLNKALTEENKKRSFIFSFNSIAAVMDCASQAAGYPGASSLLKAEDGTYLLVLSQGDATKEQFRNICLIASEYADGRSITTENGRYLKEHSDVLINGDAIAKLSGK